MGFKGDEFLRNVEIEKEKEFEFIANKIADILDDINNIKLQETTNKELESLAKNFVVYTQSTY
jgi:glycine hydroxymethyltransferase